jgi:hypothetical protein
MNRSRLLLYFLLQMIFTVGCTKPSKIVRIDSPTPGLFYTVETYDGRGPLASDFTRVYANLERGGRKETELVLDGEYLQVEDAVWTSPTDVVLRISGNTNSYHNFVVLVSAKPSITIHTSLRQEQ